MAIAVYDRARNRVRTLIRDDHNGYVPPSGWELVPEADLPPGWTREPAAETDQAADAEHNARIEAAQRIVDDPREPIELATWAAMQEVIEELRAAKAGKPKASRTDADLREAAKARLSALKREEKQDVSRVATPS
jgi:hypothetical protein